MNAVESFFDAIIQNPFLHNALFAILLIGITSGIIGSLLVSNRIVFVGGGVAHCAYGGIGIAIFFGFSVLLGSSISAILVAFLLAFVKKNFESHIDTFSAILWAFGMSIGVVFINISSNSNIDMESYLFGSLISVDMQSLVFMSIFDIMLIIFICVYYREVLNISYDYEFCKLKGINTNLFMNIIFVFIAIGVIFSMQVSGLILVLAMLSIPAYIANIFTKTLKAQMVVAGLFSFMFMIVGLFLAFTYNILPGAAITFVGTICIIVIHMFRFIINTIRNI